MFVNDNHFIEWMEKLYKKMNEVGKDLKSLIHTNEVFENGDHWDKKAFEDTTKAKDEE
ncbi:hypothetical protein EZS27_019614 [termite gut metagenome]|uniref:Uncharacterized protein n=1 Tax=termite gut metagenome TaxID=433724 RepID=A0A5J4RDQ5_9ZZZZ